MRAGQGSAPGRSRRGAGDRAGGRRTRARRAPHHPPLFLAPQEKQYAHWMAGCRLASKGRTMADSSYASEVQAILAFLSLQRTGGGGSGNHPQGPDASAEGLNPYGLVAPRFQRKFKAKQVPKEVGGGNDHGFYLATLGPWISTRPSSRKPRAPSFLLLPLSLRRSTLGPTPWEGSRPGRPSPPQGLAQQLSAEWCEGTQWRPHAGPHPCSRLSIRSP